MVDQTKDYTEGHTVRSYNAELETLRVRLLEMGGLVVDQVAESVKGLTERDPQAATRVIEREQRVNRYDTEVEELAFNLIAKRQPIGVDLRAIIAMLHAGTDLERCGDEAKKIAKIANALIRNDFGRVPEFSQSVTVMSRLATRLLREAVEALDDADIQRAVKSAQSDAELDSEYKLALRLVHELLLGNPAKIDHASEMVIVIKALERIGDHAKNIAKYVIFLVEGKDVRHVKTRNLDREI